MTNQKRDEKLRHLLEDIGAVNIDEGIVQIKQLFSERKDKEVEEAIKIISGIEKYIKDNGISHCYISQTGWEAIKTLKDFVERKR